MLPLPLPRTAALLLCAGLLAACAGEPEPEIAEPEPTAVATCWPDGTVPAGTDAASDADTDADTDAASGTPDEDAAAVDATDTPDVDGASDVPAPAVALEEAGRGYGSPVQVLPDPAGRTLVVDLGGTISTLEEEPETLLDLRGEVGTENEQGLLGAAFTPDGQRMLVHYTALGSGDTVVSEYAHDDGELGDEVRLLRLPQAAASHNGGSLLFGPDGWLYLALGDAGVSENGQDTDTPYGGVLRMDACEAGSLRSAPDNPGHGEPRLWMSGLRNPYRIAFDGDLLVVADVGLGDVEEINVVPRAGGQNLGWPALEGSKCHLGPCDLEDAVAPDVELLHTDDWCAVIGGVVYRGSAVPDLAGHYLFGDFCRPGLVALPVDDPDAEPVELGIEADGRVLGFGVDAAGEAYVTTNQGVVQRIVAAG